MSLEERVSQLENAFVSLVKLTQSMDERLDTHLSWINQLGEAQANSEAKIAALADAQIKTEGTIAIFGEGMSVLGEGMSELGGRMSELTERMSELTERMSELAAAQAHTDSRLDALIDIVREGRGGNSQG